MVGHIFSSKRNDNEELSTWSCHNCTNPEEPTRSARRHAVEFGMSESTVRRILHKDLGFHPYKMMVVQTLNEGNYQQRLVFAEPMLEIIEEHEDAIMMMIDEAHFQVNGSVN